jgi:hypothetical protein
VKHVSFPALIAPRPARNMTAARHRSTISDTKGGMNIRSKMISLLALLFAVAGSRSGGAQDIAGGFSVAQELPLPVRESRSNA